MAQDPQRHTNQERVPEESLRAQPLLAPPEQYQAHGDRRQQHADVAEDGLRARIAAEPPTESGVHRDVQEAGQQVAQGASKL
jgi:hypothetical protein